MTSKNMALGGLLTALTMVVLYLTLLIPTNTLTLLTIASFMAPLALIRGDLKTAWLVYICSAILAFFMLPLNTAFLYAIFFGCYGIFKSLIEKLDKLLLENILKFILFNILFFISLTLFKDLISPEVFKSFATINLPVSPNLILWGGAQISFFIFDYALTLLIDGYYRYFSKY